LNATKRNQTKPNKKNIITTKNIYLLLNKCVTYSKNYAKKKKKTQKTKTQKIVFFFSSNIHTHTPKIELARYRLFYW